MSNGDGNENIRKFCFGAQQNSSKSTNSEHGDKLEVLIPEVK
jgi:hypothetical protein